MDHNPPTSAELAASDASAARDKTRELERRIEKLERAIKLMIVDRKHDAFDVIMTMPPGRTHD